MTEGCVRKYAHHECVFDQLGSVRFVPIIIHLKLGSINCRLLHRSYGFIHANSALGV